MKQVGDVLVIRYGLWVRTMSEDSDLTSDGMADAFGASEYGGGKADRGLFRMLLRPYSEFGVTSRSVRRRFLIIHPPTHKSPP